MTDVKVWHSADNSRVLIRVNFVDIELTLADAVQLGHELVELGRPVEALTSTTALTKMEAAK